MMSDNRTNLHIRTNPINTQVSIYDSDGKLVLNEITPFRLSVNSIKGKSPFRILINNPLYENQELVLKRNFNLWYLGNIPLIPVGMLGFIGLFLDDKFVFSPYGEINFNLVLSEEGIEHQRQQELARQEQERRRIEAEERQQQYIRSVIGNSRVILMEHQFNLSNPHGFNADVVYHITNDYLYIHQWLNSSFIGSFLPEEASWQMPYNTQFFVRNIRDLSNIGWRISNIYMKYMGVQNFTRGNGSTMTLAVFDVLYYE
jgi:hypothetical protein